MAILGAVVSTQLGPDPSPEQAQDAYNLTFLLAAGGSARHHRLRTVQAEMPGAP